MKGKILSRLLLCGLVGLPGLAFANEKACDLDRYQRLEADFSALAEARRLDPASVDEQRYRRAARLFIDEGGRCYDEIYPSRLSSPPAPTEFDNGGLVFGQEDGDPNFGEYVYNGTKWGASSATGTPGGTVTYSFMVDGVSQSGHADNNTAITSLPGYQACFTAEIVLALDAWSAVADIQFAEVTDNGAAFNAPGAVGDIRIGGHVFDGSSGVLAHAYYPPPNGSSAAGDMHFDVAENWSCTPAGGIDIGIVALHEVGHSIGLNHQDASTPAMMNPFYNSSLVGLLQDDIDGGVFIYGAAVGGGNPDPDDQISEAINSSFASPINGEIDISGDVDMYSFSALADQVFTIDVDVPHIDLDSYLRVFDNTGMEVAASDDNSGPAPEFTGLESFVSFTAPSSGIFYLGVSGFGNPNYDATTGTGDQPNLSTGHYQVIIASPTVEDPDDSIAEALSGGFGVTISGNIGDVSDVDVYEFYAETGQVFEFSTTDFGSLISDLRIADSSGAILSQGFDEVGLLDFTAPSDGYYYVAVSDVDNLGSNLLDGSGDASGLFGGDYELVFGPVVDTLAPSASLGDRAGNSVHMDGEWTAVGAKLADSGGFSNNGAVDLYKANGDGTWSHNKRVLSSAPHDNAHFGHSVAISGDILVVGEHKQNTNGFDSGAFSIYGKDVGGPDNWGSIATNLSGGDTDLRDYLGRSIDVDGDVIVVGAHAASAPGNQSGAVYVFDTSGSLVKKLVASDGAAGDRFGAAVSVSGDHIVVGAFRSDVGAVDTGAAYVFQRDLGGANNWGEVKKLVASSPVTKDHFGYSVGVSWNTVAIGMRFADSTTNNQGAVIVFERNEGGVDNWGETQRLEASVPTAGDRFGSSISIDHDNIVVGAVNQDDGGDRSGRAYVFKRELGTWSQVLDLYNTETSTRDEFGYSVSVDGKRCIVGSWLDNRPSNNTGAAYLFGL